MHNELKPALLSSLGCSVALWAGCPHRRETQLKVGLAFSSAWKAWKTSPEPRLRRRADHADTHTLSSLLAQKTQTTWAPAVIKALRAETTKNQPVKVQLETSWGSWTLSLRRHQHVAFIAPPPSTGGPAELDAFQLQGQWLKGKSPVGEVLLYNGVLDSSDSTVEHGNGPATARNSLKKKKKKSFWPKTLKNKSQEKKHWMVETCRWNRLDFKSTKGYIRGQYSFTLTK